MNDAPPYNPNGKPNPLPFYSNKHRPAITASKSPHTVSRALALIIASMGGGLKIKAPPAPPTGPKGYKTAHPRPVTASAIAALAPRLALTTPSITRRNRRRNRHRTGSPSAIAHA